MEIERAELRGASSGREEGGPSCAAALGEGLPLGATVEQGLDADALACEELDDLPSESDAGLLIDRVADVHGGQVASWVVEELEGLDAAERILGQAGQTREGRDLLASHLGRSLSSVGCVLWRVGCFGCVGCVLWRVGCFGSFDCVDHVLRCVDHVLRCVDHVLRCVDCVLRCVDRVLRCVGL